MTVWVALLTASQPTGTFSEPLGVILGRVVSVPSVHLKLWLHFALDVFLFFKLIDSKHQILWDHNSVCPHVDCKFLSGVFCGCIDLESVCVAFPLSLFPSLSIPLASVHFMAALLPDYVQLPLHCWLMALQLPFGSQDLSVMWEKSTEQWLTIYIYFCVHIIVSLSAATENDGLVCTWKHRNNAAHNNVYCKSPSVHLKLILMAI